MSKDNSSESDSSDSEVENEDQMELGEAEENRLKDLESKLAESPNDYSAHVELIELLRKLGELEKLRSARKAMSSAFPLTPKLWLEWLQDEIEVGTEAAEMCRLFDLAADDYVSFDVWLEYVQWAIGALDPQGVREVFERAITAVGLQVNKGKLLWDAHRELEMALLATVPEEDEVKLEAQQNRIGSLFKRQLAIPLIGMEETYTEWREYLESIGKKESDELVESSFKRAKSQLEKLLPLEDALEQTGQMEDYLKYISFEQKCGDPSRVISIYERAVLANCLNFHLWIDYGRYLDKEVKIGHLALKVYGRAVRNCPWVTQLWTQYFMVMEKYLSGDWEKLSATFEQSLNGGFSSAAEGVDLWLSFAYAMRRKIQSVNASRTDLVNGSATGVYLPLSEMLQRGANSLKEIFKDEWDSAFQYRKSWAYMEARYVGNVDRMRELWQEIMHEGNARFASMWLEYFQWERQFGDVESRRKLLLKAVHSASDYPESICHQLLQFEREEGSLDSLETAMVRVEQQLGRLNERRAKKNEWESPEKRKGKPPPKPRQSEPKKKTQLIFETSDESPVKPRQPRKEIGTKRPAEDEPKAQPPPVKTEVDTEGFAIPSGPPVAKRLKVEENKSPVATAEQIVSQPKSKPTATVDPSKQHDTSRYPRTVFISNLDFHLSDPETRLRDVFAPVGSISEIRLVKHISGRFKGYAYVEFNNEEPVAEALKLDHHKIEGRPMYVSRCEERKQRGKDTTEPPSGFKFGLGLDQKKLFVRNIPTETTEDQLREIFQPYDSLKEVRLATFRNGKSKGWAFVEFEDENSASKALMKTDGTVVRGKPISVAISNPPPRKDKLSAATPMVAPTPEMLAMKFTPALGGQGSKSGAFGIGSVDAAEARKERLDVFKPRVVANPNLKTTTSQHKNEPVKEENSAEPSAVAQSGKLSNEQFRNLFMKKD